MAENWNPLARAGVEHARTQLTSADMEAIEQMPATFTCEDKVFGVHDSPIPSDHGMNYLRTRADAATAFRWVDHSVALIGHTHVPACFATIAEPQFTTAASEVEAFQVARRLLGTAQENRGAFVSSAIFDLPKFGRAIVNPGSVGQPRDRDPRAAYLLWTPGGDGETSFGTLRWRRINYEIDRTVAAMEAVKLPQGLRDRLYAGR